MDSKVSAEEEQWAGEYQISESLGHVPNRIQMLASALIAAPFVIARNVYGLLEVATESSYNSIWSPITGNVLAVALLGLLTEVGSFP